MENRQLNTFIRKYTANYNYEKHQKKNVAKEYKSIIMVIENKMKAKDKFGVNFLY